MPNRLINEQSPYLLQHAHNPVDWYPWGDEPFARAKAENMPVIVSIGYAACHWCHVMERESFESEEVAAFMNAHFICIKVDREEHPDVDHLYMDAVQAISGSGGWPLNVFVTPERVPFYGGTYFPPRPAYNRISWIQLLQRMHEIWTQEQNEVKAQSGQMLAYLQQASQMVFTAKGTPLTIETSTEMVASLMKQADRQQGGFGGAPKFPGSMALSFLLEHYHFTGSEEARDHALFSLDRMIGGGIYDQLGGGFARYATDAGWLIPHFEKMLYDNALLILPLCDAYQITGAARYKRVIEETIAFAERELKDATGVYYSALDADSEGVEGKFYTWTWEEWSSTIDDPVVAAHFGVSEDGNWEHTNILNVAQTKEAVAAHTGLPVGEVSARIATAKEVLMRQRDKRVRPGTDDKSLLSWNALMNQALSRAGVALGEPEYLRRAEEHMQRLLEQFETKEGLKHVWKQGVARIGANLDDYAYLIQALLQLATATGNGQWISKSARLCDKVMADFLHEGGSFFYYTPADQLDIPVRKVDLYDGATPSANSVMAGNLLLLGMCMERTEWTEQGTQMLHQMADTSLRYTYSFGYWALLQQRYAKGLKTVVVDGQSAAVLHRAHQNFFLPQCFIITSKKEISEIPILEGKRFSGESLIFVCTQQACLPPVSSVEESLHLISAY